jgi:bla regulator protein BlaR1
MEKSLQQILPDNIAQALCHTFVHSLWQGLILAMLTGLIILLTKKSSAAIRYNLLVGTLLLFTITLIGTLVIELKNKTGNNFAVADFGRQSPGNFLQNLFSDLNFGLKYAHEHAGIIVSVWLLIICLRIFKMAFGLYTLERLKKIKVNPINPLWEQRIAQLAKTMGIKRAISFLESGIVKVPLMIGYLKPVILIPVGLINALEQQEVEAILLHELAHIRRGDYLVNLLQSLVETLFFFNPAVLWLSSLIRAERENCCDDIVVDHTKNKIGYIKALIHYQEQQLATPDYALAFSGNSNGLLQRLKRLASSHNRSLNKLEMMSLAVLLLISTMFVAARPRNTISLKPMPAISTKISPAGLKNAHPEELEAKKKAEADAARRTRPPDNIP